MKTNRLNTEQFAGFFTEREAPPQRKVEDTQGPFGKRMARLIRDEPERLTTNPDNLALGTIQLSAAKALGLQDTSRIQVLDAAHSSLDRDAPTIFFYRNDDGKSFFVTVCYATKISGMPPADIIVTPLTAALNPQYYGDASITKKATYSDYEKGDAMQAIGELVAEAFRTKEKASRSDTSNRGLNTRLTLGKEVQTVDLLLKTHGQKMKGVLESA